MHNKAIPHSCFPSIDFKTYFSFLFMLFLPSLYLLLRVHLLGNIPSDHGVNIASQIMWLGLAYEVAQEAIFIPLYAVFGNLSDDRQKLSRAAKRATLITLLVFSLLALFISLFSEQLALMIAQQHALIEVTVPYIRLESLAGVFAALTRLGMIILMVLNLRSVVVYLTVIQVIAHFACDSIFIGQFPFSYFLGVNGLAVSTLLVHVILCAAIVLYMRKHLPFLLKKQSSKISIREEWLSMSFFSGGESLLKNIVFAFMTVRMVNLISEQGTFWLANHFIWGWLLLPVLALTELIKIEVAKNLQSIRSNIKGYVLITSTIILLWGISYPLWRIFIQYAMNAQNAEHILQLTVLQMPFYAIFSYFLVIQAILYGAKRMDYLFYQSAFVNIAYYGTAFCLFILNIFKPTLNSIALLFGGGLILAFLSSCYFFRLFLKKEKITLF